MPGETIHEHIDIVIYTRPNTLALKRGIIKAKLTVNLFANEKKTVILKCYILLHFFMTRSGHIKKFKDILIRNQSSQILIKTHMV